MSRQAVAMLGLATTEELMRELIARFQLDANYTKAIALAEMLGSLSAHDKEYRTVDT